MAITVSIPKAKDVHKENLRADRKPKLEALDVLFIRAQEAGSDTTDIVSKKQQLRDVTNTVDEKTTLEDIKAVTLPDVGV